MDDHEVHEDEMNLGGVRPAHYACMPGIWMKAGLGFVVIAIVIGLVVGTRWGSWRGGVGVLDAPVFVMVFQPPLTLEPQSSGILLAVWKDGTVLYGVDPVQPDRHMRVGRLTSEQMTSAWSALEDSGYFSQPETRILVPDSSSVRVRAVSNGSARTHEIDKFFQSELEWWSRVESAADRFRPDDSVPVEEVAANGVFRGYKVGEWSRTSWAR